MHMRHFFLTGCQADLNTLFTVVAPAAQAPAQFFHSRGSNKNEYTLRHLFFNLHGSLYVNLQKHIFSLASKGLTTSRISAWGFAVAPTTSLTAAGGAFLSASAAGC
jgi:hypothetical protein